MRIIIYSLFALSIIFNIFLISANNHLGYELKELQESNFALAEACFDIRERELKLIKELEGRK